MPSKRRVQRTPDSGYKFECQYCEGEVFQGSQPELIFLLEETKRGGTQSTGFQACIECADEIREENAIFTKEHKAPIKQTVPLRPSGVLEDIIPEALKEQIVTPSQADTKLDKLIDLMTLFVQSQMVAQVATKRVATMEYDPVFMEPKKNATAPKPKRKILAPPEPKKNARTAAKPKNAVAKAKAKQKSSRSR